MAGDAGAVIDFRTTGRIARRRWRGGGGLVSSRASSRAAAATAVSAMTVRAMVIRFMCSLSGLGLGRLALVVVVEASAVEVRRQQIIPCPGSPPAGGELLGCGTRRRR